MTTMFEIPKLAQGGFLTQPSRFVDYGCEDKDILPPVKFRDKYYGIYKRTKKARIKKKAAKKSWILALKRELEKPITIRFVSSMDGKGEGE